MEPPRFLLRCADCETPLVRDVCPRCVGGSAHLVLVLALVVAIVVMRACDVDAQPAHAQDAPPHVTATLRGRDDVARCLVAEARPGDDYPAILAVLSRRSPDLAWAARHYCAIWVTHDPSARQTTIRLLPSGPGARAYARHWEAAQGAIGDWLNGRRADCTADHFGDRHADARRARRRGLIPVACGQTQNLFFVTPRGAHE